MSLRDNFIRFMTEYRSVFERVWRTGVFKDEFGNFVRHDIADALSDIARAHNSVYSSKGSVGQTKWTPVPWLAVFDNRITRKATEGEYIVYLLNSKTKELYLTFNQASEEKNNAEVRRRLQEKAINIRSKLSFPQMVQFDPINSGNAAYDAGCICYIKYSAETIPDDLVLRKDLTTFLDIYDQYYRVFIESSSNKEWWPSKEEYDPQITKEKWLELLNAGAFNDSVLAMLSQMQRRGGATTCAELAEETGKQASHYIMTAVHAAEKVHKLTGCPILENQEDSKYWPVLFVGKRESVTDRYIWKIREELQEALLQFGTKIGRFDSWEIVDETTAIKTCDKSFFDYNGSGVPKEICWFFDADNISNGSGKPITLIFNGKEYSGILKNDTTDRRRIQIRWNSDLGKLFDTYKNAESKATFVKKQTGVYEITIIGGEKEMTTKEQVAAIRKYIEAKGFNYDGSLIENFYLGLKSKPFVILAGTSGTGKTRLVRLFAEAIKAEYKLVSVRPDWSDSSDLFGHVDLNQKFVPGAIIDFVKQAELNPTKPYFLCLDEMNLARVEYYMSDILSAIETRRYESGMIITDPVVSSANYGNDPHAPGKYGNVILPGNLYIVGTVNMDETTFPFSKKVLDRANTIEFSYVDLLSMPSFSTATADKITVTNEFLVSKYITLNDCDAADREYIGSVCTTLSRINSILEIANAHIGYRVRDEIVFYMLNNREADLLDDKVAFDNQIMQKILPRVQGSSESIKTMLGELLKICESEKYEASAKKINFMIKRYEEDGFTSYWL